MAKVKIDRFGRILIPKEIRKSLGIEENSELEIEVKNGKILIQPRDSSLEKRVEEAITYLKDNAPKPFTSFDGVEEKWYPAEYCMRKIGLKE